MAIYSSTLIIRQNNNYSDAELIKLLNLDIPLTGSETHKISNQNVKYNDIIDNLSNDKNGVFVSSKNDFTIIVSFELISDFSNSIGLLKSSIERIFPESEYFFFFSETVSMLNGFVWSLEKKIKRKKYVQNGKYVEVYDHIMDIGELLPEEKKIFPNKENFINGYPINEKDYMFGTTDFQIAIDFLKSQFKIENPDNFLSNLILNRNIYQELSTDYINNVNNKLKNSEIVPSIINHLKPLMKELKFKLINFKEKKQLKKSIGFYKELSNGKRIIVELKHTSFRYVNYVTINLYIKCSSEIFKSITEITGFTGNGLGIDFYSTESKYEINKLTSSSSSSISNRNDLTFFIQKIDLDAIKILINNVINLKFHTFFESKEYYQESIEALKSKKNVNKKFPSLDPRLKFCLIFYLFKNNKLVDFQNDSTSQIEKYSNIELEDIKKEILEIVDFQLEDNHLSEQHNKTILATKKILSHI